MNVRIAYQDNQNWTDLDSKVSEWTNLRDLYKHQRVQSAYLAPEVTTDSWNGKTFDVQHIRWNAWYLEFWIKESELQEISRLQSCRTIIITDIDNNLYHEIDLDYSEYLEFTEPERIADTANWKVSFTYRQGKTIINKASLTPLQTNTLITDYYPGASASHVINTFYTDFDVLAVQDDTQQDTYTNETGINTLSKAISQNSSLVLFYLSRTDANSLKKEFERAQTITINGTTVLQNNIVEYGPIGEGLIKVVCNCLTENEVVYPLTP